MASSKVKVCLEKQTPEAQIFCHVLRKSEQYEGSVENKKERIEIAGSFPLPPPPTFEFQF